MNGDGLSCHEPLKALVVQWKLFVIAGIHLLINFPFLAPTLIQCFSCKVAAAHTREKQLRVPGILMGSQF